MKKNKIVLAVIVLAAAFLMPADAGMPAGGIGTVSVMASGYREASWVYDTYDILTDEEEADLNQELEEIYNTYGFDAVILTSRDVAEDERRYAAEYMQKNNIGYGENRDGMILFHQPSRRNIAVVFRGEAQNAFDTRIQDILLDDCTEYLREDDPYGAYKVTIRDLRGGLERWAQGKSVRPMDVGGGIAGFTLRWFLIFVVAAAVPVFIMTVWQKGKMKTVVPQSNADAYIPKNGVLLEVERDIFLRTNTIRTPLPKKDDSGPSGGSGSFQSGGESFSGSSRNY